MRILLAILMLIPVTGLAAEAVPRVQTVTLKNGLTVMLREDHAVPLVAVELRSRAGAIFDPTGQEGLASLTATLMTYGTKSRSEDDISEQVALLGGSLRSYAGTETFRVGGSVPVIDPTALEKYLEILGDVVVSPTFPTAAFDKVRTLRMGRLQGLVDSRSALADRAFDKAVFGTHPYARPSSGTLKSIASLTFGDVMTYHRTHVCPQWSAIGLAGDFDSDEVIEILERTLGASAWSKGEARTDPWEKLEPAANKVGIRIVLIDTGDETLNQAQIRLGLPLSRRYLDDGWHAAHMGAQVLGGSFTARLNARLRVKEGLTYGARWRTQDDDIAPGAGYLATYTSPKDVVRALKLTMEEIGRFRAEPIPTAELDSVKQRLVNGFVFRFETATNVLDEHMDLWQEKLPLSHLAKLPARLEAVTSEDIKAVAGDFPDRNYTIVVVGNQKLAEELKAYAAELGGTLRVETPEWLGLE